MSFATPTKVFAYVDSERASLYGAIMRVFVDSSEQFVLRLHPADVFNRIRFDGIPMDERPGHTEIESALAQLCDWGNIETHPDTPDAGAVKDLYNPGQKFQMTREGEAAEKALALYRSNAETAANLQCGGLADIRIVLEELQQQLRQASPDTGKIYRRLLSLRSLFGDLCSAAQTFINRLDSRADLRRQDASGLIEFGRRLLGDIESEAEGIGDVLRAMEPAEIQCLLQTASERSPCEWSEFWDRLRSWFISQPGPPSHIANVSRLRERARACMPVLIRNIADARNRQIQRIDRANDFQVLARWFAEAESDADAHILWRVAFGLCPARHLLINDATLGDRESREIPAHTSWRDAPPLRISMDLQNHRGNSRIGGLSRIIDRSGEKKKLAAAINDEAQHLLNAQRRFGTGNRIRLSDLKQLDTAEFELFLDLLGDAMSARLSPEEIVEVLSSDGCLKVRLEPTGDERKATVHTAEGAFTGPDQWIRIEPISTVGLPEALV